MELIEIIINILFLSGLLFLIVVTISYLIYKSKSNYNNHSKVKFEQEPIKNINQQRFEKQNTLREKYSSEIIQRESNVNKVNNAQNSPKIIKIATSKNLSLTIKEIEERKKSGNGSRYTIVNDKINKLKIKAANFYL